MRQGPTLIAFVGLVLGGSPAFAQEAPRPTPLASVPAPDEPPTTTTGADADTDMTEPARVHDAWYGWQLMIPDAIGSALMIAAIEQFATQSGASTALLGTGLGVLSAGGPMVHVLHGREGGAAGSLGLRLGGALFGFFIGAAVGAENQSPGACLTSASPNQVEVGLSFGLGIGATVGAIIDEAALAWESVDNHRSMPTESLGKSRNDAPPGLHLSLAPMLGPRVSGLGVGGTF
jgi:hypothetical protein